MVTKEVALDILLKNGEVIDPSQDLWATTDIGLAGGCVAEIAAGLPTSRARRTYDLTGKIVTPGLIDMHCHPVGDFAPLGVDAQHIGVGSGVTLLCDAGSAGAANFSDLRARLTVSRQAGGNRRDQNKRRPAAPRSEIIFFLNVAKAGQIRLPEIQAPEDMDIEASRDVIAANRDMIRGVKIRAVEALAGAVGLDSVAAAKRLASDLKLPLMLHIGETRQRRTDDPMDAFSREALGFLGKGDILSHYLTWEPGGMVRPDGRIEPALEAARDRGVVLDVAHGLNHFSSVAAGQALKQGLPPTTISTDLCQVVATVVPSLSFVMSKFLNLGLPLDQIVAMTTRNPARALGMAHCRGSLTPGMPADITVLEKKRAACFLADGTSGEGTQGDFFLEPQMVFKAGEPGDAGSGYNLNGATVAL